MLNRLRAEIDTKLFINDESHRRLLSIAGITVAVTAILVARLGLERSLNSIWAEDGEVFVTQAAANGNLASLDHLYAAYLHTAPRLLATLTVALPVRFWAPAMTTGTALLTGLLAAATYAAMRRYIPQWWIRLLVVGGIALLPAIRIETLNNVANLQWTLLFASFWMVLWQPKRRSARIVAISIVALTIASDPLSISLLPLVVARLWAKRDRTTLVMLAAIVLAAAFQAQAIMRQPSQRPVFTQRPNVVDVVQSYAAAMSHHLAALWVVLAIVFAASMIRNHGNTWTRFRAALPVLVVIAIYSAGFYLAPVFGSGERAPRYELAPTLLALSGVGVLLSTLLAHQVTASRRWTFAQRATPVAFCLCAAVMWLPNFSASPFRTNGPLWTNEVDAAQTICTDDPGLQNVALRIDPVPWSVTVSCNRLR